MAPARAAPSRHLSIAYVVMLSVGMVVGAGIFKSPALVAENAGSAGAVYGVWLLGGLISLIGALCYAELSTTYPDAGGDYHFLTLAYGPTLGFAFAWARFAIINTGSIALLGFVIGDYLNLVVHLGPHGPALYALASVVVMTAFNLRGAKAGAVADYVITSFEVLGLLLLTLAAGWLIVQGIPPASTGPGAAVTPAGFGYALVFVLLAFGGWSEMSTLSAEIKDQKHGMVKALIGAILVITTLYMVANWALLRGLGVEALAKSQTPAADLMRLAFGAQAGLILALAVAAVAITSINGTIIVGARTTYAAAGDRPALAWLGQWDPRRDQPAHAIMAQGVVSVALVVLGAVYQGFATLVDYTAPVYWGFLTLSGLAVIRLRLKNPGQHRPFQVPLYPVLPLAFALSCAAMLWSSLTYVRTGALFGLGVLVLGLIMASLAPRQRPST